MLPQRPITLVPPLTRRNGALLALAGIAALATQIGRPIVWGSDLAQVLLHAACVLAFAILPGWMLVRALRLRELDPVHELGLGWMLGTALVTFAFLALHALGAGGAILAWPLVCVPLYAALSLRSHESAQREPLALPPLALAALLAIIALAGLRTQMLHPEEWWYRFQLDTYFHAGNAAALAHGFPIENPRIAGEPLNYHVLSYVPFAIERLAAGIPIEALFLRVGVNTLPLLVLLQTFNAGRALGRNVWAGVIAAALVMLHVDPAEKLANVVHPWFQYLNAHSYLEFGVYYSPSTCVGLAAFATLAFLLQRWLERGQPGIARGATRELALAAIVAAFASGAKGSVMPVVVAGFALPLLIAWVRRKTDGARAITRALVAFGLLAFAAAPASLVLASGEHSFARTMFRVLPWATAHEIPLAHAISEALGNAERSVPHWVAWSLAPLWTVLYLNWGGVVACLYAWSARATLSAYELWLVGAALAGFAASNLVAAPGASHLFFTYNGELGLACLAGAALTRGWLGDGRRKRIALLLLAPYALGMALDTSFRTREDVAPVLPEPPGCRQYREALDWLRTKTPENAIVITSRREVLATVLSERSAYYETELFTPGYHERGWDRRTTTWKMPEHDWAYPERNERRRALFQAPSAQAVLDVRRDVGDARPIYVVFDKLQWRLSDVATGLRYAIVDDARIPELDPSVFEVVFSNDVARIARCAPASRAASAR